MAIFNSNWSKFILISTFLLFLALIVIYKNPIKRMVKRIMPTGPVVVLKNPPAADGIKIIFFHHSTGKAIWDGGVFEWLVQFRNKKNKNYYIVEQEFPKELGNYPYDYWNIWVNNQGDKPYKDEPTLEMITRIYDIIILKHCFPVSDIEDDINRPDIESDEKRIENYKLQYEALKNKMHQYPDNKFIIWTGAARVKLSTTEANAKRAKSFFDWVGNVWDEKGDNIFLWDFYTLECEGGIYLKDEYASSPYDPHPNESFSKKVSPLFCQRIVDVIEDKGDSSNITGENGIKKQFK